MCMAHNCPFWLRQSSSDLKKLVYTLEDIWLSPRGSSWNSRYSRLLRTQNQVVSAGVTCLDSWSLTPPRLRGLHVQRFREYRVNDTRAIAWESVTDLVKVFRWCWCKSNEEDGIERDTHLVYKGLFLQFKVGIGWWYASKQTLNPK